MLGNSQTHRQDNTRQYKTRQDKEESKRGSKETVKHLTNLSLCCHSKQRLLASNNLHRPDSTERLTRLWELDFPALNAAQLPAVVMAPAVDGSTPAPGYRPIRRAPENEASCKLN